MAAFFSNISAKIKECGTFNFLFLPLAGLVTYKTLFHMTMVSPLLLAGTGERVFTFLTALFFAFLAAALLTTLFAAGLLWKNETANKAIKTASLFVFSVFMTLLAIVVIENFTYTMFRFGIKNTDGTVAKLFYLLLAGALIYFFMHIGEAIREKVRATRFLVVNALTGLAAVVTLVNLSDSMSAWASIAPSYPNRYNVVIVSSDGIAASRMSAYGYRRKTTPFIDSISDELLIARNAYSNNGHTTGAITSLLTGMLPTRTKVVLPPDSLRGENAYRSLPRILRKQGYYANNIAVPHYADAIEQNILEAFDVNNNRSTMTSSFPVTFSYRATNWFFNRLLGEAIGLTEDILWIREVPNPYAQVDGQTPGNRNGYNDMYRLQGLIGDIAHAPRPMFVNSHFLGTHGPFFNPKVRNFSLGADEKDKPWAMDRYDDAILTFDTYVKRVYQALQSKGMLESTILVIMSDHDYTYDTRQNIPLMIRFPGLKFAGTVIDENVQTVDVAPTIIDFLGGTKPAWMEGDSLIAGTLAPDRHIFSTRVDRSGFIPGVGFVRGQLDGFGKMDFFYLVQCNKTYKLDVVADHLEVNTNSDRGAACSDSQRLDNHAALKLMRQHLADRY